MPPGPAGCAVARFAHIHMPRRTFRFATLSLSHPLPSAWRWDQAEELYY